MEDWQVHVAGLLFVLALVDIAVIKLHADGVSFYHDIPLPVPDGKEVEATRAPPAGVVLENFHLQSPHDSLDHLIPTGMTQGSE